MTQRPTVDAKKVLASAAFFFNEHKFLIISLSVIAGFFFFLWRFASPSWSDFGLNAFTETVGIILTVFLVDQIIKNQERRRIFPLQVAAFRDVASFVDGLAVFWLNAYNNSGQGELPPPPEAPSMQEFLTMTYFTQILKRINLDAEAPVIPKRTWWDYFPQQEDSFRQLGEKILERHAAVLDPYAYELVHRVLDGFLDPHVGLKMLPVLRQLGGLGPNEAWEQLPEGHRNRLGRYWVIFDEQLKDFADLHAWYRANKKLYLGHD
ncbi:MAG TPA: hypothetical protein VNA19_09510 [Pyrinomonadaceae bacterium]|jgi:hypothetical protein|nr:hypothetical protein [Pyrinomonadaceae bacterium]